MNSFVRMCTLMLGTSNFAQLAISYVFCIPSRRESELIIILQVNLLFVVDEVSDDQNGMDARTTGQVFVNAMKYPEWDDGSILAKITKE